jgi:hypothetical protein
MSAGGCARTRPIDEAEVADGTRLRGNRCKESELMVVENRTGFPVRVRAVDERVRTGIATDLQRIKVGVTDTVRAAPGGPTSLIVFDVDRPASSGSSLRSDGLTIHCMSR